MICRKESIEHYKQADRPFKKVLIFRYTQTLHHNIYISSFFHYLSLWSWAPQPLARRHIRADEGAEAKDKLALAVLVEKLAGIASNLVKMVILLGILLIFLKIQPSSAPSPNNFFSGAPPDRNQSPCCNMIMIIMSGRPHHHRQHYIHRPHCPSHHLSASSSLPHPHNQPF